MLKAMSEKGEAELQDEKVQYAKCDMGARGVSFFACRSMVIYDDLCSLCSLCIKM